LLEDFAAIKGWRIDINVMELGGRKKSGVTVEKIKLAFVFFSLDILFILNHLAPLIIILNFLSFLSPQLFVCYLLCMLIK
jgi:hypothetical protein